MLCIFPESKNVSMQWLSVNSHSISAKKKNKNAKTPTFIPFSRKSFCIALHWGFFGRNIVYIFESVLYWFAIMGSPDKKIVENLVGKAWKMIFYLFH